MEGGGRVHLIGGKGGGHGQGVRGMGSTLGGRGGGGGSWFTGA